MVAQYPCLVLPPSLFSPRATCTSFPGSLPCAAHLHPLLYVRRYGFVQPQVKLGRAPPAPVKVSKGVATSSVGKHLAQQRQYPVDCGPLVERQPRNVLPGNTPVHGAAVMRVSYSSTFFCGWGHLVGCGGERWRSTIKVGMEGCHMPSAVLPCCRRRRSCLAHEGFTGRCGPPPSELGLRRKSLPSRILIHVSCAKLCCPVPCCWRCRRCVTSADGVCGPHRPRHEAAPLKVRPHTRVKAPTLARMSVATLG